jgi:hypothetical protein
MEQIKTVSVVVPVFNEADQLTYFIGIQKNVTAEVDALQRVEALEAEIRDLKAQLARTQG